uniref:Uncharacterized protein n=1 Tax=Anguilla anguilla TaxID=7936 RepID=A0A0E9TX48_ANGAN
MLCFYSKLQQRIVCL